MGPKEIVNCKENAELQYETRLVLDWQLLRLQYIHILSDKRSIANPSWAQNDASQPQPPFTRFLFPVIVTATLKSWTAFFLGPQRTWNDHFEHTNCLQHRKKNQRGNWNVNTAQGSSATPDVVAKSPEKSWWHLWRHPKVLAPRPITAPSAAFTTQSSRVLFQPLWAATQRNTTHGKKTHRSEKAEQINADIFQPPLFK